MHTTDQTQDIVILVGFDTLDELALLAETGNCQIVGDLIQKRDKPHPKSYLGKGKVEELQALCEATGANGIICDDELTSAQLRHLAQVLDVKVMDRTMLILDIFAGNAKSAEAIAQVEIAQQRYNLAHLTGLGITMSRIGGAGSSGGVGTRGPGEKKLELDRRAIRNRIDELAEELKSIETHRHNLRKARMRNQSHVLSLVGYTNAGKSSLMNALTEDGTVLAQNRLFSTLDTTTRKLPEAHNTVITDTVGFIQKLPHTLIKAFRSTLEELAYATVLLHVVDISNPNHKDQMDTVYETLHALDIKHIPIITIFNKIDAADPIDIYPVDERATKTVAISAKNGINIDKLQAIIEETLSELSQTMELLIPYSDGSALNNLHQNSKILQEEYKENGTFVVATVDNKDIAKYEKYLVTT